MISRLGKMLSSFSSASEASKKTYKKKTNLLFNYSKHAGVRLSQHGNRTLFYIFSSLIYNAPLQRIYRRFGMHAPSSSLAAANNAAQIAAVIVIIEHTGSGKTEGESRPDAQKSPTKRDAEEITQRKRDDEIGHESHIHQWFYMRYTAQGVGIGTLKTVAELVNYKRYDDLRHHQADFAAVGKPTAYGASQQHHGHRNGKGNE